MKDFFVTDEVQKALNKCMPHFTRQNMDSSFQSERDSKTLGVIHSLQVHQASWDAKTQFNIGRIGEPFLQRLEHSITSDSDKEDVFCFCFYFALEANMFHNDNPTFLVSDLQRFAINNINQFSKHCAEKIEYALRTMPLDIVKSVVFSQEISTYTEYLSKSAEAAKREKEWEQLISTKQRKVEELQATLEKHETAFNFVSLYKGFATLSNDKNKQLRYAKIGMFFLGSLIPLPLIFEAFRMSYTVTPIDSISHFIKAIPFISLTLIFIYYFRVALNNVNSIKAQLSQIELRKSLCQFIQSYAEYAKEIKSADKDLLSKFEDIVFSNIMTSDEKIPSTFDGIEQIATLISSVRGNRN